MPERVTREFHWQNGFIPTQTLAGGIPGSIISGSNVWIWGAGLLESAKGFASNGSAGDALTPLMNVGNTHGGVTGGGTVVDSFGTTFVAGSGNAYKGGSLLGAVAGTLKLLVGGSLVNVGIAQPSAPTLAASATTGKNDGSYSVCITKIRSATGEESTRSLPSNVVAVTNKKLIIGGLPTTPVVEGVDKIGIYCSFRNFGATGPWFHLIDIDISASATYETDWFNGELGGLAPIDHDPPPGCTHCFAVNNVMVAAGSFGGSGLSPSIPGSPGAYPPDFTVFIPGGGSITGCKATGFSGAVLVATASSLNSVIATNSPITPITVRQLWPTTGFATGSSWCTVEDEVYGFSGQRGAVRTQGDGPPDTTFANAVHKYFGDNGFTASNTTVGYDPKTDSVMFCKGSTVLCFARSRGYWHCPMTITGTARTGATVGGDFLLDVGGGALQSAELGAGVAWNAIFAFDDGGDIEMNKSLVRLRAASNSTVALDVLTDLNIGASVFAASATANHSAWEHLNVRNAKTFSIKASGSASGQSLYEVAMQVIPHPVTR